MKFKFFTFLFIVSILNFLTDIYCINLDVDSTLKIGSKIVKGAKLISDKEEIRLGREIAANLLARYGLYEDEDANRYINLVGRTVAKRSKRNNINYYFAILDKDIVNAFAAPGGYVFITKGALNLIKDEAELAGVLAHEVSHISERHIAKEIQKSNLISAGIDIASEDIANKELIDKLSNFCMDILFKGYSRKDEKEADLKGVELASISGYNSNGLICFIQKLTQRNKDEKSFNLLLRTHPSPQERLNYLKTNEKFSGGEINEKRYKEFLKM